MIFDFFENLTWLTVPFMLAEISKMTHVLEMLLDRNISHLTF